MSFSILPLNNTRIFAPQIFSNILLGYFYSLPTIISPPETRSNLSMAFPRSSDINFRNEPRAREIISIWVQCRMRILLNAIIDDGEIAIYCRSEGMTYGHDIVSR